MHAELEGRSAHEQRICHRSGQPTQPATGLISRAVKQWDKSRENDSKDRITKRVEYQKRTHFRRLTAGNYRKLSFLRGNAVGSTTPVQIRRMRNEQIPLNRKENEQIG